MIEALIFFVTITAAMAVGMAFLRFLGVPFQAASYTVGVFSCGIATAVAKLVWGG